ncbi:hypothetical protein [Agriterribacter sp.]|uniref:hypothetical protein n=1 Tax=Agriterribacter sp. TaxID=2821509 RepID=UPI002BC707C2|nr:hypothetical protein [Agriterribacter sp.]HRO44992.1 hypothetical protein [Agriterribacter sp.]HRQ15729.1 hypothetical protein [Agriterribacter sp.]
MKVHTVYLLFLCCLLSNPSFAQDYFYNNRYYESDFLFEGGLSLGAINCLTDIGGRPGNGKKFLKDLNWQNTRMSGGIFVSFTYRYALGARLEFNMGNIMAYDSILKNDPSEARNRYRRNLHFKSRITELLLLAELHPLMLFPAKNKANVSPYLVGGTGLFIFDPRACLNGEWVSLNTIHTEGQGFEEYPERKVYKLTQLNFPVGAGIQFECSALLNLRIEILHRITRTDYLDDVSTRYIDPDLFQKYLSPYQAAYALQLHDRQKEIDPSATTIPNAIRGNNSRNDSYFTVQCKLSLIIGRERR